MVTMVPMADDTDKLPRYARELPDAFRLVGLLCTIVATILLPIAGVHERNIGWNCTVAIQIVGLVPMLLSALITVLLGVFMRTYQRLRDKPATATKFGDWLQRRGRLAVCNLVLFLWLLPMFTVVCIISHSLVGAWSSVPVMINMVIQMVFTVSDIYHGEFKPSNIFGKRDRSVAITTVCPNCGHGHDGSSGAHAATAPLMRRPDIKVREREYDVDETEASALLQPPPEEISDQSDGYAAAHREYDGA